MLYYSNYINHWSEAKRLYAIEKIARALCKHRGLTPDNRGRFNWKAFWEDAETALDVIAQLPDGDSMP